MRRYKRFLADVRLADGRVLTVHCPNSGAMTACCEPGRPVWISDSQNPARKLRFTWELIKMGRTWVGVNTANPNQAVAELVTSGCIPELSGYGRLRREVAYGRHRSRIDILLEDPTGSLPACYVEVKNATMRVGEHAAFPDAVTERGQKHLRELSYVARQGLRAVLFFFVGRADCQRFRAASEVDPDYARLLRDAVGAGVEVLPYRMHLSPRGIALRGRLPFDG